ncbi:D-mannonate epimerase (plasmid) [Saccharobesus litoralis]|uniref:gluconokinase n=2 Tax=Saccharobesus litoralis TaxID=2172099 RepID=A0A2S0VYC4_9ALTE|nr:D-mannonate epimerase [Saccharobesus litoralis]
MGVSGCGKSSIGNRLAQALNVNFYDGDDFHPQANIDKMSQGIALQDEDRWPWLKRLADKMVLWNAQGGAVLACSALKQSYRDVLASTLTKQVTFVYLKGSQALIASRMAKRKNHFMPTELLNSQFAALQEPNNAIVADISQSPEVIVQSILESMKMTYPIHVVDTQQTINDQALVAILDQFIQQKAANAKRILILPPDITRFYSKAGFISAYLYEKLKDQADIYFLPALGTHEPMAEQEIDAMFGTDIPKERFLPHLWRQDVQKVGEISSERMLQLSEGKLDYSMDVAANKLLLDGNWDLIVSVGQVVPHEVIGMANYTKNILVGTGGADTIHKSHFLGAVYGMERIMGRVDTPVRKALNEGYDEFLRHLPIEFILTVLGNKNDKLALQGVFCGANQDTYEAAAKLSQQLNLNLLDKPINKAIVYLEPSEFKTTWLGNKAIYRTRMAMADAGELIILAPALHRFGEDLEIDRLIRKYGYKTTDETLAAVKANPELATNLSAAAHLIHGTADKRFNVTYCPGDGVSQQEIESVDYQYCHYDEMTKRYPIENLKDGWNTLPDGEEIFYVSNPALGLWSTKARFENE